MKDWVTPLYTSCIDCFINQPKPVPGLSEHVKLWIQPKRYVL